MVLVERQCPFTGQLNVMSLPISDWEFEAGYDRWRNGGYIQDCFPTLTAEQREFVKTGITPEKWAELFGDEE